jgi:hypothetical protein
MKTTNKSLVVTLSFASLAMLAAACAHEAGGAGSRGRASAGAPLDSTLRFRNAPAVTAVDDRAPIARPDERAFDRGAYYFDVYVGRRTARALEARPALRAQDVNALDEVPDSSWWQNRVGVREVSVEEVRATASAPRAPFTVLGSKLGGVSPGLRVRDAAGVGYLLKWDKPEDPEGETAADVVLQRLLWTVGYHTPEDSIIHLTAADLQLGARAKVKDDLGNSRPMTAEDLRKVLARVNRGADGRYRTLASKLLPGTPVGGFAREGIRPDDANDRVPHEERRETRAGIVFFSWLNHIDIKEDNFLDAWIEDPATPGRGHLRHYLVDFGNSLGVWSWQIDRTPGFTQYMDLEHGARSLVSLGLWHRPWESVQPSPLRGVGNFESQHFDPAGWRPRYPWTPFDRFDRYDGFWAAKILMRVQPAHVAAAVAEAKYSDPRTAAYITRTLIERQRKVGRHHLAQTSALDGFAVTEASTSTTVCFDDLLLRHFGADEPALVRGTKYRVRTWDHAGRPLPLETWRTGGTGRICVDGVVPATDNDGYTIVGVDTFRGAGGSASFRTDSKPQRILVHLARDPQTRGLRVIGLRRY